MAKYRIPTKALLISFQSIARRENVQFFMNPVQCWHEKQLKYSKINFMP